MTTQFIITILAISVYTASVVWRDEWTYFCWHANVVPAFFQGPFQWPAHYLPLWMGMLQYSLGCYHGALESFARLRDLSVPLYMSNKPGYMDRFKADVWKCKCLIKLRDGDNAHMACFSTTLYSIGPLPTLIQIDLDLTTARAEMLHAEHSKYVMAMQKARALVEKVLQSHPDNAEALSLLPETDVEAFRDRITEEFKKKWETQNDAFSKKIREMKEAAEREFEEFQRFLKEIDRIMEKIKRIMEDMRKQFDDDWSEPETNQQKPSKTPWQLLEISPGASAQDIRRAYKRKALELHPDKACSAGRCKTQAEKDEVNQRFREVVDAYEAIIKSARR